MKTEITKTEVNIATVTQRLKMLPAAPAAPVNGRGAVRHCLTGDDAIVDLVLRIDSPHFAAVSVRHAEIRFLLARNVRPVQLK